MNKLKNKLILVVGSILLIFSIASTGQAQHVWAADDDIVTIPDPNLKAGINAKLGQAETADVTEAQMATINNLSITTGIADFTGIEFATNLQYLYATSITATTIDPITQLTQLDYLNLAGTTATIPDLNNMTALTNLSLYLPISSDEFYKLNQLPNLTYLSFESNMNITDISALVTLPELATLRIQFCGVTDFTVIPNFPKLTNLSAFGQNTGRLDPLTSLYSTDLQYDATAQTLHLPFSMMPNRLTNFDGIQPPFTTSNAASQTYFDLNGIQVPSSRLVITDEGLTVTGMDQVEFDALETFEYNARLNNPAGSYAQPDGYSFYAISSGTYLHGFTVNHNLEISAEPTISYDQGAVITETQFLADVEASISDGVSPITSDFSSVVNFAVSGNYVVTLNAENTNGLQAAPVQVTVTVVAVPGEQTSDNNASSNNSSTNNLPGSGSSVNNTLPVTGQQNLPIIIGGLTLIVAATLIIQKRK